jgi:hypothetical protein
MREPSRGRGGMEAALDPSRFAIRGGGTGFCIQIAVLTRCAIRSPRVLDRVRGPREVPRAARSIAAGNLNKKCAESGSIVAVNTLEPTRAILRRSLHREVVERLRKLILAGELEPRSRVNEAALCERFGIPKCRSKSSAARISQTATLETEFCGQRISTLCAANEPQRRRNGHCRPTTGAASPGNVVPIWGIGNHFGSRGLPGGGRSPAKPVSDIFKLAGRGKFPGISQFIREFTGFWVFWPTPAVAQASERSGESEPNGANSLSFGSGNNRGWCEISLLTTLLG